MKQLVLFSTSLLISFTANATFSTNIDELDPAKSKAPFCLSKLVLTKGPGQMHMIGSIGRKGNDTFTYEIIDNEINKIAESECNDPKLNKSSTEIVTKINDTCIKSCDSDAIAASFNKKNTQGAIGSATLNEFQLDCRMYCRLSNSFRTTMMSEKTYEGLQLRAILLDNQKIKQKAGVTNQTIPEAPVPVTPVKNEVPPPAGDKLPPAVQGQIKK